MSFLTSLLSGVIGSIAGLWGAFKLFKKEHRHELDAKVERLILVSIQYPYLESDEFCSAWDPLKAITDEKYMRYDNYCCLVFNLLEDIFEYFGANADKIEDYIGAKELITRHKTWWSNPGNNSENTQGYPGKFRKYLETYL